MVPPCRREPLTGLPFFFFFLLCLLLSEKEEEVFSVSAFHRFPWFLKFFSNKQTTLFYLVHPESTSRTSECKLTDGWPWMVVNFHFSFHSDSDPVVASRAACPPLSPLLFLELFDGVSAPVCSSTSHGCFPGVHWGLFASDVTN